MKQIFLILLFAFDAAATIVGQDNFIDYGKVESFNFKDLALATATQIELSSLKSLNEKQSTYPAGHLYGFCPDDPRANQRTLGGCSGFLIAPDVLVTAGHCRQY